MKVSHFFRALGALALVSLAAGATSPAPAATSADNTAAAAPATTAATTTPTVPAQKIAPVLTPKTPPGTTVYNVRDFGATGDGTTIDSDDVNRAIDAAEANGGGTVYFPAGYYLCYSIHLKTNITLYLDQGSWIVAANSPLPQNGGGNRGRGGQGGAAAPAPTRRGGPAPAASTAPTPATMNTTDSALGATPLTPEQQQQQAAILATPGLRMYDLAEENQWSNLPRVAAGQPTNEYQDFGHSHWQNSLIWGDGVVNVSIIGPGTIFGRGLSRGDSASNRGGANKSIALKNCRNVTLRDFTIYQGGWFGLLATGVDNLVISGLKVDTNRDGFDIDCCHNVKISDCFVNSPQDDGIVLKSSYALGSARTTEDVTITSCQVSGYALGTFLDGTDQPYTGMSDGGGPGTGRIKFGTESNGGFKNITISNCVFDHCRGLALESVDGAIIEDITITNIAMRNLVNSPIYIRLGHRLRGPEGTTVGAIRRINISNIVASNVDADQGILIVGDAAQPIEDVHISNVRIDYKGGGTKEMADIDPPETEPGQNGGGNNANYPEPKRLGIMPSYGLFARHVKGLTMDHVEFSYAADDLRPPVVLDDVANVEFEHLAAQRADGVPAYMLWNVTDFTNFNSPGPGLADARLAKVVQGSYPAMPATAPTATTPAVAPATTPVALPTP
jgi:polygalacturonase